MENWLLLNWACNEREREAAQALTCSKCKEKGKNIIVCVLFMHSLIPQVIGPHTQHTTTFVTRFTVDYFVCLSLTLR